MTESGQVEFPLLAEVCLRLARVADPRYSEKQGIAGQRPLQGIGAKQANKGARQSGFLLWPIDHLKHSTPMSVGDADNMPR